MCLGLAERLRCIVGVLEGVVRFELFFNVT